MILIIIVNGVIDLGNPVKTKHMLDLRGANQRLTLWKADLDDEASFDIAVDGCEGVFHVVTPSPPPLQQIYLQKRCHLYVAEVGWERRMTRVGGGLVGGTRMLQCSKNQLLREKRLTT